MKSFTWSCFAAANFGMAIISGPFAILNIVVGAVCLGVASYSMVSDIVEIKKTIDEIKGKK